jgi:hypothetical protein
MGYKRTNPPNSTMSKSNFELKKRRVAQRSRVLFTIFGEGLIALSGLWSGRKSVWE